MKTLRLLVLEDDLETLEVLMKVLKDFENKLLGNTIKRDIAVTVFSEYTQVEDYLNKIKSPNFDLVLLDRDCKLGGSFHALDLEIFDKEKIIGISSVPEYNDKLTSLGVKNIVGKEYSNLQKFESNLSEVLSTFEF